MSDIQTVYYFMLALSALLTLAFGLVFAKAVVRIDFRAKPNLAGRCRHWGMVENDPSWRDDLTLAFRLVGTALLATPFLAFLVLSTTIGPELDIDPPAFLDSRDEVFAWILGAVLVPFLWSCERHRSRRRLVETLDGLRSEYHKTFPPSEILSMHECLSHAPPLFWKEWSSLPEGRVSTTTNQKFRERVAPYRQRLALNGQRIAIWIAILGVVVALPQLISFLTRLASSGLP